MNRIYETNSLVLLNAFDRDIFDHGVCLGARGDALRGDHKLGICFQLLELCCLLVLETSWRQAEARSVGSRRYNMLQNVTTCYNSQKTLSTKIYDNIPEHPRFMGTTAVQNHIWAKRQKSCPNLWGCRQQPVASHPDLRQNCSYQVVQWTAIL